MALQSDAGKTITINTGRAPSRRTTKKKKKYVSDVQRIREAGGSAIDARTGEVISKKEASRRTSTPLTQESVLKEFEKKTGRNIQEEIKGTTFTDEGGRPVSRQPTTLERVGLKAGIDTRVSRETRIPQTQQRKETVFPDRSFKFNKPFFSVEGQKERIGNIGRTTRAAFVTESGRKIKETGQTMAQLLPGGKKPFVIFTGKESFVQEKAKEGIQFVGQHPLQAAAIGTGVAGIAKSIGSKVALKSSDVTVRFVGKKALERQAASGGLAKFVETGVKTFTVGKGTSVGVQETGRQTFLKGQDKKTRDTISKAVGAGFKKAREQDKTFVEGAISELSIFGVKNREFNIGAKEELKRQGFKGEELEKALKQTKIEKRIRGTAEIASFVTSSASIEIAGRQAVTRQLKKTPGLFKAGFKAIAPLGIIEGGVQEKEKQVLRGEKNIVNIATAAGVGGLSAGVAGGAIVSLTGRKPTQKTLEFALNVADPFEKPGDIVADITEGFFKKTTGFTPASPVITVTPTPAIGAMGTKKPATTKIVTETPKKIPSLTVGTGTIGKPSTGPIGGGPRVTSILPTKTEMFTKTKIVSGTPSIIGTKTGGKESVTGFSETFVPVDPVVPIDTIAPGFVPSQTIINNETIINTKTNLFTNTFSPISSLTNVNINVPVFTPTLKLPPLFPPPTGGGSGAGRGKKKKKAKRTLKYAPSLSAKVLGIKGKRKKVLTGLEVRPIPI